MKKIEFNFNGVFFENFYSDSGDRVIKLTNLTGSILKIKIHFYYGSVFFPFAEYRNTIENRVWITPNTEHVTAASFIFLYINDCAPIQINLLKNKKLKKISNKIVCVGLNKTGTTSLSKSLETIKLKSWAGKEPITDLNFSNYSFSNNSIGTAIDLIEKTDVDFYQDIPFSCPGISERIIKQFPQAKYILTKRDSTDQWVNSVKKFWKSYFIDNNFNPKAGINTHNFMYDRGFVQVPSYLLNLFESWDLDSYSGSIDEKLSQVYEKHNESVKKTLDLYGCDSIEINVAKKGEFKKLTEWLNIENNVEDFLWFNKTV